MKDPTQVKILSKSLIKPSSPTPNHLKNYKLCFFDQVADTVHIPLVLFYPHGNNNSKNEELEESLSRVLTHAYPLAGRFSTEDESTVLCLDQGVTYIKATVNCKLDDFLQQTKEDLDPVLSFWPQGIMDVDETNIFVMPLMVVQVTTFECGGLALGFSCAHPAMDGFTAFTFIYEWAKVCKFGTPCKEINNFMSFNLGTLFPVKDLTAILEPPINEGKRPKSKLVARKFVFEEAAISRLREKFDSEGLSFKPSRVEMITTLLWRSLIRAAGAGNPHLKRSIIAFPFNLRGKVLAFPEIANSFGNLIIEIPIRFEHDDETKMESLHHIVKLIRETVQETTSYCAKSTPDEIASLVVNLYKDSYSGLEWGGNNEVVNFTSSSLCRFPIHKVDFGWGKPSLMHFGSRHSQMFWLYDTECETSIAVQIDLEEKYMNSFVRDQDIMDFAKF
ncbi:acetyl-CoA-benzylalcohol acetyltransferase-like [Lycium barbarum]|uniref:acetyl-CoA-benzylalcohol acetyltransferase-like n=1 Tax=Lycium barbarum TaxID=112863 RepID=UPI00293ECD66|nr:acetyl-CoA-benzylalcohol acetyltransferase-like [Lycium barbarum]